MKNPRWRSADEIAADLSPDDNVVGIEINGDARAFPVKWLERPHLVTEIIGGETVMLTYCLLSNLGSAFNTEFNGEPMDLIAAIQWENNLVLYDKAHKRLIQQVDGAISYGPDAGQALTQYPTRQMRWDAWQQLYPETQVFYHPPANPVDRLARRMLNQFVTTPTREQPEPWFRTIPYLDKRLPNKSHVIGLKNRGHGPRLPNRAGL